MYLVTILDWHSRRVLSRQLSNTMDTDFCVEALEEALPRYGHRRSPIPIRASNFTAAAFTGVLKAHPIQISMDSRDRWMDNAFVDRLWRTVKYEDIYLRACETPAELRASLDRHCRFHDTRRGHAALGRQAPMRSSSGHEQPPEGC